MVGSIKYSLWYPKLPRTEGVGIDSGVEKLITEGDRLPIPNSRLVEEALLRKKPYLRNWFKVRIKLAKATGINPSVMGVFL